VICFFIFSLFDLKAMLGAYGMIFLQRLSRLQTASKKKLAHEQEFSI